MSICTASTFKEPNSLAGESNSSVADVVSLVWNPTGEILPGLVCPNGNALTSKGVRSMELNRRDLLKAGAVAIGAATLGGLSLPGSAVAATNRLGWTTTQANRWASLYATNHALWQRLLADANNPGVYADNGIQDGLVYLITGNAAYAQSAYNTISGWAGRTGGGSEPSRNNTRHLFGTLAILYSWIADALPAANKAHFRDILDHWADLIVTAGHGTSTTDSDELVGHYFGNALFALAIQAEDPTRSAQLLSNEFRPIGGLDSTGVNRTTWRNTLSDYAQRAAGGVWLESSVYNLNTVRYLTEYSWIINQFLGVNKFPEITALLPGLAKTFIEELTPGLTDSFQWGDVEGDETHHLSPYTRLGTLSVISHLTNNPQAYYVLDSLYNNYSPPPSSFGPHFYPYVNPSATRTAPSGWSSHNGHGRGIAYHHVGWAANDSFFSSYHQHATGVHHESGHQTNFALHRNGAWVLDFPRGYGTDSAYYNTMLISGGIDRCKEARGQIAYASGPNFQYHVGATGGQFVNGGYYNFPPKVAHEWTRSFLYLHNSNGTDSVVIFDRINASNPLTDIPPDRFLRIPDSPQHSRTDITNADGHHQWILHIPVANPTISGNVATWTSEGQPVRLHSYGSSPYSTAVLNEATLGLGGYMNASEKAYQLRLIPTQTSGWQTLLNVVHVGGTAATTRYTAASGQAAEAVKISSGSVNTLVIFNGDSGPLPYTINGNPVAIQPTGAIPPGSQSAGNDPNRLANQAQLRFFTANFTINGVATTSSTPVYVADLKPSLSWTVSIDGGAAQSLAPNSAGLAQFTLPSGTHSIAVSSGPGGGGNLALNKPATSSTPLEATQGPEKAFNGSITGGVDDKWCSGVYPRWLQVDLGSAVSVSRIELKHAEAGGESPDYNSRGFNIQTSTNGTTWTTAVTVADNTASTTTHVISPVSARYIKLNVTTPTQTSNNRARIYEMEVYAA